MANSDSTRGDPVLLRDAAALARIAAESLDRAAHKAVLGGLTVDAEIYACQETVTSWAGWLAGRATREDGR